MKRTKNQEKGFSLVELIIVVLILGILAVSVTPQVAKWIEKSKISADKDNANALKSGVQTSLVDWQSQGGKISQSDDFTLVIKKDGTLGNCTDWEDGTATKSFKEVIDETMASEYPKVQYEALTGEVGFRITVEKETGKVTVKCKAQDITE